MGLRGHHDSDRMACAKALRESQLKLFNEGSMDRSVPEHVDDSKLSSVIPNDEDSALIIKTISHLLNYSKSDTVGFMFVVPVEGIYPMK